MTVLSGAYFIRQYILLIPAFFFGSHVRGKMGQVC